MKLTHALLSMVIGSSLANPVGQDARYQLVRRDDSEWVGEFNSYRQSCGIPTITADAKLKSNAQIAAQKAGCGNMQHYLGPGTLAQVIGPTDTDFDRLFVGGFLCEVPTACGAKGKCSLPKYSGYYHDTTGHYQIVSSAQYRKVGCYKLCNIWYCDLA